jgi:ATP-dependent RNA helicase DDX60
MGLESPNSRSNLASCSGMETLHPYAALSVASGTFPQDLALDASDCWDLFSIMDSVARASKRQELIVEVEKLRPDVFFRKAECIKSADTIQYESALRRVMERWIATPSCKDIMASLTLALGGRLEKAAGVMEKNFGNTTPYARTVYQKSLLPLLDQLNSADALPALIFHYDRHGIECLGQELVADLEAAEKEWKKGNEAWQKKVATWQEWKDQAKTRQKQQDKLSKSVKGKSKEEMMRDKEGSWKESFDPEAPLPQFSFQSAKSKVSGQELEADIADLTRWKDIPEWVVSCLRRGIGVHHAGLNRKLRQLVETLFRAGTLRVVIATGAYFLLFVNLRKGHWHLGSICLAVLSSLPATVCSYVPLIMARLILSSRHLTSDNALDEQGYLSH